MNRVSEIRSKLNMSQEAFAEYCDISRISVARYESGAPLNRENARKIAAACNVSMDYLLYMDFPDSSSDVLREKNDVLLLSPDEKQLLEEYRAMAPKGQQRALETLDELSIVYPREEP